MSDTSSFDPDVFMNTATEGAHETVFTPVPQGDHRAICDSVQMRSVNTADGQRWILRLRWNVIDEAVKAELEMDKPMANQDIWLEFEDGRLLYGKSKNIGLGRAREACGLNDPSKPFSVKMFEGRGPCMVHVIHDEYQGRPIANIDRVVALA